MMCFAGGGGGAAAGPSSSSFGAGQSYNPPGAVPPPSPQTPAQADRTLPQQQPVQSADVKRLDVDLRDAKTGLPLAGAQNADPRSPNYEPPIRPGGVRAEAARRKRDQSLVD